ncbi:hypothetical protein H310_01057 [Aphanomyces invadans]|uniref:Uncharacterized protein n=1 Tax=Aphanomyces invadans TaxID=157072 RepID=A0A024URK8_9STRA|nr:hypothetical protein H310_01057 [Aphanomyces invadans]ETW08487.1 hypothetical protein H310_01057 [Aphanomyces invadans]|eukprot:XP_008862292.1 hypothetical protein H310_01057 [Aphanomyces invadans]
MRFLGLSVGLLIGIGTLSLVSPVFTKWKPSLQCRDFVGVEGPPLPSPDGAPDPFLRLGVPSLDNQVCVLTQFFKDCRDFPSPLVATIANALLFGTALSNTVFVGFEATRSDSRGAAASASLTAFLMQYIGISVIIPAVWFPSFLYSHATPLAHQAPVSRPAAISIAQPRLLVFIALANVVVGAMLLYLGFAPDSSSYSIAFFVFQFLPIASPWLWPLFRSTTPSSVKDAVTSSVTATQIYYAFAVLFSLHHWVGFVVPLIFTPDTTPLSNLATLWAFLKKLPQESRALPTWFLLLDGISLTATNALIVATEQQTFASTVTSLLLFAAQSVVVGPGAAFMLFCASREQAIRRVHYVDPQKLS